MTRSTSFRLVALGAASALTLGEIEGQYEEVDKSRYDMPA